MTTYNRQHGPWGQYALDCGRCGWQGLGCGRSSRQQIAWSMLVSDGLATNQSLTNAPGYPSTRPPTHPPTAGRPDGETEGRRDGRTDGRTQGHALWPRNWSWLFAPVEGSVFECKPPWPCLRCPFPPALMACS